MSDHAQEPQDTLKYPYHTFILNGNGSSIIDSTKLLFSDVNMYPSLLCMPINYYISIKNADMYITHNIVLTPSEESL